MLWCIDALSESERSNLSEMTPKLRSIYGKEGDWQSVIAQVMEFPSGLPDKVRSIWRRNLEIARAGRVTLTPQQFAEMSVDKNLAQ